MNLKTKDCVLGVLFVFMCLHLPHTSAVPLLYEQHRLYTPVKSSSVYAQQSLSKFVNYFIREGKSSFKDFECSVCKLLTTTLQILFAEGKTQEEIVDALIKGCIFFKIEDKRVCTSICHEFQNEVLTVFDKVALEPAEICGTLLGSTCGSPYNPLEQWNVTFPNIPKPPVTPPKPPEPGSPTLRVLHISDIHFDILYKPGSNADCHEPMCCRADDGPPGPSVPGAGKWGDYRYCDTPRWTLENLFEHLQNKSGEFDYIVWTGDLPAHDVWNQSRSDQLQLIVKITQMFKKYFPNKKIYSALGNHESAPCNSFPPPFISDPKINISWLYNAVADSWLNWLPGDTNATIRKGGFYVVSPYPGFRIVSINTNLCNNENWWLLLNTTDPAGQLAWLIDVLQDSENKKMKVHVIGHIPPGKTDCLKAWSWNYYKIVNRYENTITGQFFGHTHKDEFEVFYDNVNFTRPVGMAYISPSITPYPGLNMGYRIYTVDGNYNTSSWNVLDHETYVTNLTQANMAGGQPQWRLEYTAKSAYNLTSLFPEDWSQLIYRMKNNSTLFNSFYNFFYKSHPPGKCDKDCVKTMLCALKSGRSHDTHICSDL